MRAYLMSCLIALAALGSYPVTPAARGDESYFVILLAYEGRPGVVRETHTSALFIKTEGEKGTAPGDLTITTLSISWLPASLDIRPLRPPEAGVNLSLEDTLNVAASLNARTVAWGPYRVDKEIYDRARAQFERLNSGAVAYKMLDGRFRPHSASNCVHAVSDIVPGPLLMTGAATGANATRVVRDHMAPWFMDNGAPQHWLIERLGLDKKSIAFINDP